MWFTKHHSFPCFETPSTDKVILSFHLRRAIEDNSTHEEVIDLLGKLTMSSP
jgi:ribosomal protein L5